MSTTDLNVDMARSSFSTAAFAQLIRRLRHSNARYNQIARQFRCRIRPTHHAKRRAYWAGLRIDTSKARACPSKYVSTQSPPVLDRSAGPSWVDTPARVNTAAGTGIEEHGSGRGDAYMHGTGLALKNLPEITVRKQRHIDGRQRVTLRLPPLKLQLDYACSSSFQEPVPGAPRLLPRQLPEVDCGAEDVMLGSVSSSTPSSMDKSDPSLTSFGVQVYSGLCITIPPRNSKRKLQDVEADENARQPKRLLKELWNDSQTQ